MEHSQENLKWTAYKHNPTQILSPANKQSRLVACNFWLEEDWFHRVIWSDEKWFALHHAPKQTKNNRYWAPAASLHTLIESKKAYREKVMSWLGMVHEIILPCCVAREFCHF